MGNNQTDPCARCSDDSLLCLSVPGGLCLQLLGLEIRINDLLVELGPEADLAGIQNLLGQLFGGAAANIATEDNTSN